MMSYSGTACRSYLASQGLDPKVAIGSRDSLAAWHHRPRSGVTIQGLRRMNQTLGEWITEATL